MPLPPQRFIGLAIPPALSFFRHILEGIRRYAEQRPNWVLVPAGFNPALLKSTAREYDGLLVAVENPSIVQALRTCRRPVVDVSLLIADLPYPNVRVNNRLVGKLAVKHLLDCGLRRLAFAGHRTWLFSVLREQAFCKAARRVGIDVDLYYVRHRAEYDSHAERWPADRSIGAWLKRLPKPVGVFVPNDLFGLQVTEVCHQLDIRVPDDVAVLGVDDDELLCELSRPRLSSVILPTRQIGFQAAQLVGRLIESKRRDADPIRLAPLGVAARQSTDVLAFDDPQVVAAVRFVRNHAYLPLRVTDVLREVPVGRRTLERRVRSCLGHSLGTEIRRAHLERAQRLLTGTEMSITEIARHSGYRDSRHLAAAFRETLGLSASEYRRSVNVGKSN